VRDEVVELLKQLRLPHMRHHAPELLATAEAQRWEPAEAVRALLVEQLTGRQHSSISIRRRAAGFPTGKTFDAWDDTISSVHTHPALPAHSRVDQPPRELGGLRAIGHRQEPSARSARPTAIEAGHHVSWFSLENLGSLPHRHRADDTMSRAIKKIMRADLTVIDDIGLRPVSTDTAEALYRVVDAAYEQRSLALSSNLHPSGFDELIPKTIANATVDRLLHHAHVVLTTGDSIRLTQATKGKGVKPLAD
jgi:DNA replication protein DnaC